MAKSSKSWYEVYELAITAFEQEYSNLLNLPKSYIMGVMVGSTKDSNIYSQSGGVFSPSKINILIGQVCLAIFIFLIGYHLITILKFKGLTDLPIIALIGIIMFVIVDTIITYSRSTFLEIQKED
ncbi:hypothetical protein [Myroides odoratimimus]|uniref:hypothetical protein n=1 Tax=Myroides odoratimimus TaxID=76832 RepID=UPI0031017C04